MPSSTFCLRKVTRAHEPMLSVGAIIEEGKSLTPKPIAEDEGITLGDAVKAGRF
jgi:hypothetical protein